VGKTRRTRFSRARESQSPLTIPETIKNVYDNFWGRLTRKNWHLSRFIAPVPTTADRLFMKQEIVFM
jgi:hypothetical protein